MALKTLLTTTAVSLMLVAGPHTGALAQATTAPNAQNQAPSGGQMSQGQFPEDQEMTPTERDGERMGDRRMWREHMREMRRSARGMGRRQHTMKIVFAVTDANGDGALTPDEVTEIYRRIFNAMDANKDGRVTLEEVQAFWRT